MKTSQDQKQNRMTKSNSINDLQFKIELEDLKINLFSETNRFKKTFSNTTQNNFNKTIKEIKIPFDSICNYSKEGDGSEKENSFKNIIKRMLDVKKSNHLIGQKILNRKRVISDKEKIILQLYEDLRYNLNENSKMQLNLEESKNLVKEWEKSRNEIVDYCNNLKKKYSDFVKLIEDFEEKIKELHKEKEQMIRINESILEMKGIYDF